MARKMDITQCSDKIAGKDLMPKTPNIIERLWKFAKKHLVNNTYHKEFSQFFDATDTRTSQSIDTKVPNYAC